VAGEFALAGIGLLGTVVGASIGITADVFKSRRDDKSEQRRWRRDRAMAAIEDALTLVSAIRAESHEEHEEWATRLAATNLLIRLYCGPTVQGAFSAMKEPLLFLSKQPDLANEQVMRALGEATLYLEVTARFDLEVGGTEAEVEEAKERFLRAARNLAGYS
jgi:hypothetical protein